MNTSSHSSRSKDTIHKQNDNINEISKNCMLNEKVSNDIDPREGTSKSAKWHENRQDSGDLDEKFASMTGSYSEITDGTSKEGSCKTPDSFDNESLCAEESEEMLLKQQFQRDSIARFMKDLADRSSFAAVSSSPLSKRKEMHSKSSKSSITSSKTLCLPFDPSLIDDLEGHAKKLAVSMDTLVEGLTGTLHSISALSVDCMEVYRDAVCKTCDALDSNIRSMYQLMAKCEELNKSMKSIHKLHDQIKEVRRLLDLFENVVFSGGT